MLKLRVCGNPSCLSRISFQAPSCSHCRSPQEPAPQRLIVLERELFALAAEEREQQTISERYRSQINRSVSRILTLGKDRELARKARHHMECATRAQLLKEEKAYEIEALAAGLAAQDEPARQSA